MVCANFAKHDLDFNSELCIIFFRYLQEIGYTDTIIDVRSTRVRQLLGLQPLSDGSDSRGMINGEIQGAKRPLDTNMR